LLNDSRKSTVIVQYQVPMRNKYIGHKGILIRRLSDINYLLIYYYCLLAIGNLYYYYLLSLFEILRITGKHVIFECINKRDRSNQPYYLKDTNANKDYKILIIVYSIYIKITYLY